MIAIFSIELAPRAASNLSW